ncbi:XRE family transcriptional regulator [Marihabitans asiaticum]|uniref:XRE family transcriptional regulator n=1 Tax=Marihabitans asiaticum TaxID=415218 RepID=A0A560WEE8_9MICO|nr:helix-turn-helix domain-containing protein [Marihabitans asiaticum]TWD15966.1 XRE family transcriptional regulator [Marihabitans asiaticum]
MGIVRQAEHIDRSTERGSSPHGGAVSRIAAAVRVERERKGLSLSELARRASMAKSSLSQLEAGQGNPGVETVWALATALGVPFAALIDPPQAESALIRADEGDPTRSDTAEYTALVLSHSPPGVRRDLYRIEAEPTGPKRSDGHAAGTIEHVVLVRGRARVGTADDTVELLPGDYLRYAGDVEHVFEALEPGTMALMASEQR